MDIHTYKPSSADVCVFENERKQKQHLRKDGLSAPMRSARAPALDSPDSTAVRGARACDGGCRPPVRRARGIGADTTQLQGR